MTAVNPTDHARRSFLYRTLDAAGAHWGDAGDAAIALDFGAPDEEASAARRLAIADLSPLPRAGFKGPQSLAWLRAQGLSLDAVPNTAWAQGPGGLAAILSWGEALVLDERPEGGGLPARLEAAWSLEGAPGCYCVPRRDSHAWLRLTGSLVPDMLAKVCGVDLRPKAFAHGQVAQTSVARSNAILVRADIGETLAFHLLSDSSGATFMWRCLIDAMAEYGAGPVGRRALDALNEE